MYHFRRTLTKLLFDTVQQRGDVTMVDVLIVAGADLRRCECFCISSLLHLAAAYGLNAISARLVDAGMDENTLDIYGQTPADVARKLTDKLQK